MNAANLTLSPEFDNPAPIEPVCLDTRYPSIAVVLAVPPRTLSIIAAAAATERLPVPDYIVLHAYLSARRL